MIVFLILFFFLAIGYVGGSCYPGSKKKLFDFRNT